MSKNLAPQPQISWLTSSSPSDKAIKLTFSASAGELRAFNVHQGVLCKSSSFFRNSMKPEWAASKDDTNTIDLFDESVDVVRDYIWWLYTGIAPWPMYRWGDKDTRQQQAEKAERVYVLLAQAYVFGEKTIDTKYKNEVMMTVVLAKGLFSWSMGSKSVDIVYKGTLSRSPLRRLIADSVALLAHDDSMEGIGWMEFFDGYRKEALSDAIKTTVKIRKKPKDSRSPEVKPYLENEQF